MRADRLSALRQWDLEEEDAIANEMRGGLEVIASGETLSRAARFASGAGRHGAFGGDGIGVWSGMTFLRIVIPLHLFVRA
jgi:enoyl-CoA hydratase